MDRQGTQAFGELGTGSRAYDGDNEVVLGEGPGDGQLGWGYALGCGEFLELFRECEVVVEVSVFEPGQVGAQVGGVGGT